MKQKFLLVVSNITLLLFIESCEDTCKGDYLYDSHCVVINTTDKSINFLSDSLGMYELCSRDTIYFDDIYDSFIFKTLCGGNPKIQIDNDSIINLSNSNYACWPYNCQNTQLGEYEWLHTYIVDNQWIKDAWIVSSTGECSPNAKYTWYE